MRCNKSSLDRFDSWICDQLIVNLSMKYSTCLKIEVNDARSCKLKLVVVGRVSRSCRLKIVVVDRVFWVQSSVKQHIQSVIHRLLGQIHHSTNITFQTLVSDIYLEKETDQNPMRTTPLEPTSISTYTQQITLSAPDPPNFSRHPKPYRSARSRFYSAFPPNVAGTVCGHRMLASWSGASRARPCRGRTGAGGWEGRHWQFRCPAQPLSRLWWESRTLVTVRIDGDST